jgi:hypothetical protein
METQAFDLAHTGNAGGADGGACDPNNPKSKTAANGYICIGKDQACDGTTLPCCTDECSDQLGVPHDSTETLVCDTQRGNPSATGNCEDTLTPGGTNDAGRRHPRRFRQR